MRPLTEQSTDREVASTRTRAGLLERRPTNCEAEYEIKVFSDEDSAVIGDGLFIFAIPKDLNESVLTAAQAFFNIANTGSDALIQIRNMTNGDVDMLTDPIQIDIGDTTSYPSAAPSVVDPATRTVSTADLIAIDVDDPGEGLGLGVILSFSCGPAIPPPLPPGFGAIAIFDIGAGLARPTRPSATTTRRP